MVAFYLAFYFIVVLVYMYFRFGSEKLQNALAKHMKKMLDRGDEEGFVMQSILFSAGFDVVVFSLIYFGIVLIYETF